MIWSLTQFFYGLILIWQIGFHHHCLYSNVFIVFVLFCFLFVLLFHLASRAMSTLLVTMTIRTRVFDRELFFSSLYESSLGGWALKIGKVTLNNVGFWIPIIFSNLNLKWPEKSQEQVKKYSVSKNVLTFHCLNKLVKWTQNFCKVSAFSLEFQKFFSITWTIFSQYRSEQFWKENTNPEFDVAYRLLSPVICKLNESNFFTQIIMSFIIILFCNCCFDIVIKSRILFWSWFNILHWWILG